MTFGDEVRRGLSERPRRLDPKWLYDPLGSALFDAITRLPWYRISTAEKALLKEACAPLRSIAGKATLVVEMGTGGGEKLDLVLASVATGKKLEVALVDVSQAALDEARRRAEARPGVTATCMPATYLEGLARATESRPRGGQALVLFLGSNVGNMDPREASEFLRGVRAALRPGDLFLIGADLVKPVDELLLAYDDPLGVTAAFDKNVLARMNRELGADFDLSAWDHRAVWNGGESRIEMHLVSRAAQSVSIPGAGVSAAFRAGETIHTESSYKYAPDLFVAAVGAAGFAERVPWTDAAARYALVLFEAV